MDPSAQKGALMLACFSLGLGAGWMLWGLRSDQGHGSSSEEESLDLPSKLQERDRSTQKRDHPAVPKWNEEELWDNLDHFSLEELPLLMLALKQEAGINGLNPRERQRLQEIMKRWYAEAPEEALAWALTQEPERDRHFHLESIFHEVAEEGFLAGLDFLETHLKDNGYAVELPREMLENAAIKDPELLIRLCAASVGESERGGGWNVSFPVGYPFKDLMVALTELEEGLPRGHKLATYPANVMEEWVNSDPQEAYEWVSTSSHNLFHINMGDFYRAYGKIADPEEYGEFVAEGFSLEQDQSKAAESALFALASKSEAGVLESFLEELPEDQRRPGVEAIYEAANGRSSLGIDETRRRLLKQMDPEARMEFLKSQEVSELIETRVSGILLSLGHSREEVLKLIPEQQ